MDSEVQVVESWLVTPSEETPRKGLALSPLDLLLANRGHTPAVYFYPHTTAAAVSGDGDRGFFDVARVKTAMAKALVAFYPLAGRLAVGGDDGQLQIDCNAEGALLVVARHGSLTIDDFDGCGPSPELRRLFVPRFEPSSIVMAIQVTLLRCGGVALGTALHHAAADAISAFHFLQTWSALCRVGDAAVVEPPCHDRALLRARSPPLVHQDALSVFCPTLKLRQQPPPSSEPVVSEVIGVSADHVAGLKRACGGGGGGGVSTFAAVSAHVWRCMCVARQLPADAKTRLTFPASIRRNMNPSLPSRYFGNGIIWLGTAGMVRDIASPSPDALATVAGHVSGAVRRMDDEVARSAIDYFEMTREEKNGGRASPSPSPPGDLADTELRVISWLGMPIYDVDFGWGKPRDMLRAESERGGFVYLMNGGGDGGGGGLRMVVCGASKSGGVQAAAVYRVLAAKLVKHDTKIRRTTRCREMFRQMG